MIQFIEWSSRRHPTANELLEAWYRYPEWRGKYYTNGHVYFSNSPIDAQGDFWLLSHDLDHDSLKEMLECAYNINLGLGMKFHALLISEGLINEQDLR
jgi:hypothetical protein